MSLPPSVPAGVPAKKKGLPWWAWLLIGVFGLLQFGVFMSIFVGDPVESDSPSPGSIATTSQESVAMDVTAIELASAYSANEVAADEKYDRKKLRITGVVDSIGKDIMNTPYVALKGSEEEYSLDTVQCMFPEKSQSSVLASLSKGQHVTIEGTGGGSLVGAIVDDCVVISK